ncbi:MAG: hypothetical protein IE933_02900 [Sphingomonadales bacterium]|nr:hypothetical protein [Sphingomonadales bacterium]MBD3774250.1 hypothetical protein [Paracoccaceae bacterium]
MADELTFSIGPDDDVTVRSYDELQRWLEKERAQWAWLVRGDAQVDRQNIATAIQSEWDALITNIQNQRNSGQPLSAVHAQLASLSTGPLIVSTTAQGTTVLDIRDAVGDGPASFAAGFLRNQLTMRHAQTKDDLLGAVLTVFPDMAKSADWHERLKRERANYKMAARSLTERLEKEADERNRENVELVGRASNAARRIFDQKRRKWREVQEQWQKGAAMAVADIRATESSYREYMHLRGPVEYWEGKAEEHKDRERAARERLYWYFPITLIIMTAAFVWAACFLISHPDTASSKAPVALYVVVSGGLLLLSSIAFWIGRILTKLYLSEHHLRNDAEERAVMAKTYLALTNDGAATEAERQIVLNSLFRPTPDGIVKDDGPTDASLQGLIARMATK